MSDHYAVHEEPAVREEPTALEGEEFIEEVVLPLVQTYAIHGDYAAATLSMAGDPDAPNLAERVKTRHILAVDVMSLEPQILACLVADFGLTQAEAAEVPRVVMTGSEPEAPPVVEPPVEPEVGPEEPEVEPEPEPEPGEPDHSLPAPEERPPEVQPHSWDEPHREA
jgi:cell division protein FtsN